MFLEEILSEKQASFDDVASWAAQAFRIARAAIVVESEDERGGPLEDDVELLIEVGELEGDFPAHLSFFARSARTENAERSAFVAEFARRFHAHVLVSDESPDPYRMTRVSPDGSRQLVRLDAEALDRDDAYRVAGPYVPEERPEGEVDES